MFTEQDYRDQLDHKRVCSCGMCDTCDAWVGVTTQDLIATIFQKSTAFAADDEDRLTMRQAAATLDARCGEGTAARYGFRDAPAGVELRPSVPECWKAEAIAAAEDDEIWARRLGHFDAACFFQNQAKRFASGDLTVADMRGQTRDWKERIQLSGCTHARSFSADKISTLLAS